MHVKRPLTWFATTTAKQKRFYEINQSINQSIHPSIHPSINQSINHLFIHSFIHTFIHSFIHSINRSFVCPLVRVFVRWLVDSLIDLINNAINYAINQSRNQSMRQSFKKHQCVGTEVSNRVSLCVGYLCLLCGRVIVLFVWQCYHGVHIIVGTYALWQLITSSINLNET